MMMSEELELAGDEKGPWIWKAAIVALPVGLALSAGVAMFLKVTRAEKTGMEGVTYAASSFDVSTLRDTTTKIDDFASERDFETAAGQVAMRRMVSLIEGSLSSVNLGYRVWSERGEVKGEKIWKNYWVNSNEGEGEGDLLLWTTYSESSNSASVAALLSVAEWMRGRDFERRIRVAFVWGNEGLPAVTDGLTDRRGRISIKVSEFGQGTWGIESTGGPSKGSPPQESYLLKGKAGGQSETDWKMTLAWDTFEEQVRDLCEIVSEKAGEKIVFEAEESL